MRLLQSTNQSLRRFVLLLLFVGSLISLFLLTSTTNNHIASNPGNIQLNKKTSDQPISYEKMDHTNPAQQGLALVIDRHLRWQFDDIILTLQKESNVSAQPSLLLTELARQLTLSLNATERLFDLFSRYKHYSQAIITLKQNGPALGEQINLNETYAFIEEIALLQTEFFNAIEIDAFFGQDNQYAEQTLARVAIRQDPSLTKDQKEVLLQHQISQLNDTERNALQPSLNATKVAKKINNPNLMNLNMDTDIVMRASALQKTNQEWKSKVKKYQHFVSSKKISNNKSETSKESMSTYLSEHFSPNELKRLKVFLAHPELLN